MVFTYIQHKHHRRTATKFAAHPPHIYQYDPSSLRRP
jgi:hypothetical protein